MSYRVLVSIGDMQRKKHFLNLAEAEAQQQMWEMERVCKRIHGAAASWPMITALCGFFPEAVFG